MSKRAYLIGWPVSHSLSPLMHEAAYLALGLAEWSYSLIATKPANLERTIGELAADPQVVGVNVTIPHKQAVLDLVPAADQRINALGAANTLVRVPAGGFVAHNTDIIGFRRSLEAAGLSSVTRVLILGSGGSARACISALGEMGASEVGIVARRKEQASQALAALAGASPGSKLPSTKASCGASPARIWPWRAAGTGLKWLADATLAGGGRPLLINTTPLGMWPNTAHSPLSPRLLELLTPDCAIADLVYRPRHTALLREAMSAGLTVISGDEMLVQQGLASLGLWLGQEPGAGAADAMRQVIHQALQEEADQSCCV